MALRPAEIISVVRGALQSTTTLVPGIKTQFLVPALKPRVLNFLTYLIAVLLVIAIPFYSLSSHQHKPMPSKAVMVSRITVVSIQSTSTTISV